MDNKIYIHYGHNRFDNEKWNNPINRTHFPKPSGGLWASPINAKFGWKDWCEQEDFRECTEENSFSFTLSENANIYHIYCKEDVERLPMQYCSCGFMVCPDFERILEDGYDAIEYHLSEEKHTENYCDSIYSVLYTWDCDSILILNPGIIQIKED